MEFFLHPSIEMYVQNPNISHHKPIFDIKKNGTWYTPERLILGKKTKIIFDYHIPTEFHETFVKDHICKYDIKKMAHGTHHNG